MGMTVTIDELHFNAAAKRAKDLGTTPEAYIESLIDHASKSFDDILAPIRKGFESMSDKDLDDLFDRAKKHARANS
ncbi:MAG TPA: hypothetical protein VGN88_01595 [Phycisphaerae bacterium]